MARVIPSRPQMDNSCRLVGQGEVPQPSLKGSSRRGLPVSCATALAKAGAKGGKPGSPIPECDGRVRPIDRSGQRSDCCRLDTACRALAALQRTALIGIEDEGCRLWLSTKPLAGRVSQAVLGAQRKIHRPPPASSSTLTRCPLRGARVRQHRSG